MSVLKREEKHNVELQKENDKLKSELRRSSAQGAKQAECQAEQLRMQTELRKRFSQPQIDRMLDNKSTNWKEDDYRRAITLMGISDKAYKVTRELLGVPLPARSAVKKLLSRIEMTEGTLQCVLDLIKAAGETMSAFERQVSICFDEVQLSNKNPVVHNSTTDQVQGPHKLMQVGVISGIFSTFSNPVFYQHSCPVTKKIVHDVVSSLHDAGFTVRLLVCDLGFDNQKLLKELEVDEVKPHFQHPKTSEKIFVWADPPHCQKLLRNHLLDTAIDLDPKTPGKRVASRETLQALVNETSHKELPCHPLTQEHLNVQGADRQRCGLTRELLHCDVANALERLAGHDDYKNEEAVFKVKLIDWFFLKLPRLPSLKIIFAVLIFTINRAVCQKN